MSQALSPVSQKLARISLVIALLASLIGSVWAQGGPPLITDDPGTPGNKHWEINTAFTDSKFSYGTLYEIPHLDLNYGYGDNLQLKFEGPISIFNGSGSNFATAGFAEFGVKWRFKEESKTSPAISTYPQVIFLGSEKLGQVGVYDPGIDLFLPIEFTKAVGPIQLDYEFGVLFRQFAGTDFSSGVCGEYDLTKRLALLGEVHDYVSTDFNQHQPVWNLGFKYDLSEHESILFSAGRGFGTTANNNPTFITYIGLQTRL